MPCAGSGPHNVASKCVLEAVPALAIDPLVSRACEGVGAVVRGVRHERWPRLPVLLACGGLIPRIDAQSVSGWRADAVEQTNDRSQRILAARR